MKLLIFIIILIIIYFVTTQIKVVHIDTLPKKQQLELSTRDKVRSMLVNNYVKCPDNKLRQTPVQKEKFQQSSKHRFVTIVKNYFLNTEYVFNPLNLVVDNHLYDPNSFRDEYIYNLIKQEIAIWCDLIPNNYRPQISISPSKILSTKNQFLVYVKMRVLDNKNSDYCRLLFFIELVNNNSTHQDKPTKCQLVSIKNIDIDDYYDN